MLAGDCREEVGQLVLVVLPSCHRPRVDRLTDLGQARRADDAFRPVEVEAGRVPLQSTRVEQPARNRFEIGHGLLIVDPDDRCGQDPIPMRGESTVLPEPRGNVVEVARPANASEIIHPAGDRDIAKVPAAVDEDRVREHRHEQPDVQVIVRKLIDDPVVPSQVQRIELGEVLAREPLQRMLVERGDVLDGRAGSARDVLDPFEGSSTEQSLTRSVDPGMAGQDLLDEGGTGSGHADDEDRPPRLQPEPGGSLEEIRGEGLDQPPHEPFVVLRAID
jgi:hypothetical protein